MNRFYVTDITITPVPTPGPPGTVITPEQYNLDPATARLADLIIQRARLTLGHVQQLTETTDGWEAELLTTNPDGTFIITPDRSEVLTRTVHIPHWALNQPGHATQR